MGDLGSSKSSSVTATTNNQQAGNSGSGVSQGGGGHKAAQDSTQLVGVTLGRNNSLNITRTDLTPEVADHALDVVHAISTQAINAANQTSTNSLLYAQSINQRSAGIASESIAASHDLAATVAPTSPGTFQQIASAETNKFLYLAIAVAGLAAIYLVTVHRK